MLILSYTYALWIYFYEFCKWVLKSPCYWCCRPLSYIKLWKLFSSKFTRTIYRCPCLIYNYILNQPKNKKYKVKYSPIKTADKVRWYYCKQTGSKNDFEVFAFLPGSFPAEVALPMDKDVQFEKTILSYCNKVISDILGYPPVTAALTWAPSLFWRRMSILLVEDAHFF